jgi:cysteine desulfurase
MSNVYLDRIAATPLLPEVREAMAPFLGEAFGNPQSLHAAGRRAQEAAALVGAKPGEIVFTASGTEANNFAVKGLALGQQARGRHIVVSAIEHSSVLNSVKALERQGFSATLVPVDRTGLVDPADVEKALTSQTVLVSVMTANSEVGTIEPVAAIAAVAKKHGALVHTDAVAAAGIVPLDVQALGVDALSLAGDQFYGPKGAAALFVRKGVRILPLIDGGIQEGGKRGGTENVPAIVGLGRAARLAVRDMGTRRAALEPLRDRLFDGLSGRIERIIVTGSRADRLPHHASFCVEFIEGEAMLLSLDMKGVAAASGSACTSKSLKVSHVLLAMGLDHAAAQGSLVFSLVDGTTAGDIDHVLEVFPPIVERLRRMSPLWTEHLKERGS